MALTLGGPIPSANGRNEILEQLAAKIRTLINPAGLRAVYDYRTVPTEVTASASISFWSGSDSDTPDLAKSYVFLIHVMVSKKNGDEAAEQLLNQLMQNIWGVLRGKNRPYWSDCYPAAEDTTPPSPPEIKGFRRGLIYARVKPL